jgi:hypothetical protein
LSIVGILQDKKATLMRLQEMIFGRKSDKRKKADSASANDEEKKEPTDSSDKGVVKDQAEVGSNENSEVGVKRRGHGRIPAAAYVGAKSTSITPRVIKSKQSTQLPINSIS